jgi:hypothetical protein
MKKILLILLIVTLAGYGVSIAGQATIAWDANSPTPDGYRIFKRIAGTAYNYEAPDWEGNGTTCTITELTPGRTYYFVARAYVGTDESGDSNEVEYTIPTPTPTQYCMPLFDIDGHAATALSVGAYLAYDGGKWYDVSIIEHVTPTPTPSIVYNGNVKTLVYHKPDCKYYQCATCTIKFYSRQDAIDAGYKPCGTCKP